MSIRALWTLLLALLAALSFTGAAAAAPLLITQAESVNSAADRFPESVPIQPVQIGRAHV